MLPTITQIDSFVFQAPPHPPPFQTMGEICLLVTQMIYLDEPLPAESQEKWDAVRAQEKYTYEPAEFRLL